MPADRPSVQAITIKKQKILDRHKFICQIVTHSLKLTTTTDVESNHTNIYSIAAARIRQGLEKGYRNLRPIKHSTPILQTKFTSPVIDQENINKFTKEETQTKTHTFRKICKEIREDIKFISNDAITMTVEVLRRRILSTRIGDECDDTGMERNVRTLPKPDGTYMIPVFSGGHWCTSKEDSIHSKIEKSFVTNRG